ncbi:increased DNA methylation 1-like [Mangifera indica]|uniref:increased DNA methylation 1-like n=1 Tax=Mangifera indica TaxID=29780 RepID=UPI001CF95F6F|nr:increased DNA methylation 1-like [Mangifera indica]
MAFAVKHSKESMGKPGLPLSSPGAEAVVQWYLHSGPGGRKNKNNNCSDEAKNFLLAMRWSLWYADKGGRKELRYTSPNGKVYYSLRTACKACIDEELPKEVAFSDLNKKHMESCSESSHASQSRKKRTREMSENLKESKRGKPLKTLKKLRELQKRKKLAGVQVISESSRFNLRVVLSKLIEKKVVTPGALVCYSGNLGEGWICCTGIKCKCCNKVFTMSDFEAHLGSKKHRPAANIFLEDGRSLLDCQKELLINNESASDGNHQDVSYDACCVCHYGGELIICDLCPTTYHKDCLGLKEVPTGDWFCPSCCCAICGEGKFDISRENSVDDGVVRTCHQCEHKYHMGCLRKRGEVVAKNYAHDKWFCSNRCGHVFTSLNNLTGLPISLGVDDLTWRLLKNGMVLKENQRKIKDAIDVMHECFEPAEDPLMGKDLVEDVILNNKSEMRHKNFEGFYTAVVEKKGEIVSVATVRVFEEVAEVPLVATKFQYRRQGMCQSLMGELERQLFGMGVMKLVLPSAPNVLNTWTTRFGFSKMTECERLEYLKYTLLDFQDTIMCHKLLSNCQPGATWPTNASADTKFLSPSPTSVFLVAD